MLPTINRSAVVLRPRQPFLEWASTVHLESPTTPAEVDEAYRRERTIFLVPEYDTSERATEILGDWAQLLFEEMLEGWSLDIASWPTKRDWETFQEWFDFELFSGVIDTFDEPLQVEE
jgi:hypothetical protein